MHMKPNVSQPVTSCPHRWNIASEMKAREWTATCRLCGATRSFPADGEQGATFNGHRTSVPPLKKPDSVKRGDLLDALRATGQPITTSEVVGRTGLGDNVVRKLLVKLAEDGLIERDE